MQIRKEGWEKGRVENAEFAVKIFSFGVVATLSHGHEETDGFFKVLRGDRGHLREYRRVWVASGVSRSVRSQFFWPYRSFGAVVVEIVLQGFLLPEFQQ